MLTALLLAAAAQAGPPAAAPGARTGTPPDHGQPAATLVVEPAAMAIAAWDADGDGRTTRAELQAGVRRSFESVDTQRKGKLRYLDFADWSRRFLGDQTALPSPFEADTDGDDAVSLAELETAFAGIFDRLDKDHDGAVTRAECLTIRATAGGDRGPGGKGKRGRGGPPPGS